jgi:hypothetical protein
MSRLLAESGHFKVISEYETVFLHFKDGARKPVIIGDFYGDPDSALISGDECYVAMAGCGLIIYFLREPFEAYNYHHATEQYCEFFRSPPDVLWSRGLYQDTLDGDRKYCRFIAETDEGESLHRIDTQSGQIERV